MAITVADLKFFKSERMTDNSDGGGQMTANEIVSGQENQIFDDVSDVDRAAGDISIRKVYAAVTSADTDKYLDAGVVVFDEPNDPAASVLAFTTGSYYDERSALKERIEQTISRAQRWNGWLWGAHFIGQRAITLWQRPENELPSVGGRLNLSKRNNSVEIASEFLWITKVTDRLRTQIDSKGSYTVREVICEIAEALVNDYGGLEPTREDPAIATNTTLVYNTRYNPESVAMFGIKPLSLQATTGDFSVKVSSLYQPVIPTSLSETLLPDINPGGDAAVLIAGNTSAVPFTTTLEAIKPNVGLYVGNGIKRGSLSITVSGATLTDDGQGAVRLSGTEIGAIDYSNGIVTWNSSCPNYGTASKAVSFIPAARSIRVAETFSLPVTISNRGYLWIATLTPIPVPGSLRVSYLVNNVWYELADIGNGVLRGVDSSYGSGTVSYSTGTATLTTGALPDVGSRIIFAWGVPIRYVNRGGYPVDPMRITGQTQHLPVKGTVSVSWVRSGVTYTLTDAQTYPDGTLSGAAGTGFIRYTTGEWWIRPTIIAPSGTDYTITYNYYTAPPTVETFDSPTRNQAGEVELVLDAEPIAGTLEAHWKVSVVLYGTYWFTNPQNEPEALLDVIARNKPGPGGLGLFVIPNGTNGALDFQEKTLTFIPDVETNYPQRVYQWEHYVDSGGTLRTRMFQTINYENSAAGLFRPNGTITVTYRSTDSATTTSETVTPTTIQLDLTMGFQQRIVYGSTRFRFGSSVYVDTAGQIYKDPSPTTGAGTLSGTLDRSTGIVTLSSWTDGATNAVTLESLITEFSDQPIASCSFRTSAAPIRPGTFQLRYQHLDGTAFIKTVDDTGNLTDNDCTIDIDHVTGVVDVRFGMEKVDSALSPAEKLEAWYDPDVRYEVGGELRIWKPEFVYADSIYYNAVVQTFLPPDSNMLGLNAARLPVDGKALVFNTGRLVLVHHTATKTENSLSPTQQIDCNRTRLYRVVIDDATGKRLPPSFYTTDRVTGIVTMAANLDLTGYSGPYAIRHTVADLARIVAVDINGTLQLNKPLTHTYPHTTSRASSVLFIGTMQARYTNLFAQSSWTSVWSDTLIGDTPLAQYNDVTYPIIVSNLGAYQDRFVIRFTSSTAFACYGENLGYLGAGNINEDFSPINPLTSVAYFSIDYRGWGGNWATGNCLRFNIVGACYPVDLIRAIQPSNPSGLDVDTVELLFVGNVYA